MSRAYIARAKKSDWRTPLEVLEPIRDFFEGRIDLDPCGHRHSLVRAKRQYLLSQGQDGLSLRWRGERLREPSLRRRGVLAGEGARGE